MARENFLWRFRLHCRSCFFFTKILAKEGPKNVIVKLFLKEIKYITDEKEEKKKKAALGRKKLA